MIYILYMLEFFKENWYETNENEWVSSSTLNKDIIFKIMKALFCLGVGLVVS